jgi:hypothetical protein
VLVVASDRIGVREKQYRIDTVQLRDRVQVGEQIDARGITQVFDAFGARDRFTTSTQSSVAARSAAASSQRTYQMALATAKDSIVADQSAVADWTSAVLVYCQSVSQVRETVRGTRALSRIRNHTGVRDRWAVSLTSHVRDAVAVSDSARAELLMVQRDALRSVQTLRVGVDVSVADVAQARERTTYSTISPIAVATDILVAAENVSTTAETEARAIDQIMAAEFLSILSDPGFLASVTYVPDSEGRLFAHAFHTLDEVLWAHAGRVGRLAGVFEVNSGEVLPNRLALGRIQDAEGRRLNVETLWMYEGARRDTRVSDGTHERQPLLREDEARFAFGKGLQKPRWDLVLRRFDEVETAVVRVARSKRRY